MTNWLTTWGNLLLTAVLVGVTAWYAWLTNRLSSSSRAAADSARLAAEAAQASVAASVAAVRVRFEISPRFGIEVAVDSSEGENPSYSGLRLSGIDLHGGGDTLYVHFCDLMSVGSPLTTKHSTHTQYEVRCDPHQGSPVRLHRGETETFDVPEDVVIEDEVSVLEARVWYSLTKEGSVESYSVTYRGVEGVDFEVPAQ